MPTTVYTDRFDDRYRLDVVTHDDPYLGVLHVTDLITGDIFHELAIGISFGAVDSPTDTDIEYWRDIAKDVIDTPMHRSRPAGS